MTTKKWILTAIGVTAVAGAVAGYRYFKKQAKLLNDYDIRPVGIRVISWAKDGSIASIEFTVRITNKAAIEATITRLYTDIYLNNQYVGYATIDNKMLIPAHGSADGKFQVTFAPKQVLKNLVSNIAMLLLKGDLSYRLKGYARVKSGFIGLPIPFDETGSVKKDLIGSVPVMT